MKTRQLRLNEEGEIRRRTREMIGKELNVVLRDRTVILGQVDRVNETSLIIKNLRGKNQSFEFSNISEIYFDTKE